MAVGRDAWATIFQLSPILLQGGLIPPWAPPIPIFAATGLLSLISGATSGAISLTGDNAFAQFQPLPGSAVLDQQIATYPFANLKIAANSIIDQPKHISFQMTAPARGALSYWLKTAQMAALIMALKLHNENGGSYVLVTPSWTYFDCLMRNMRDTSSGQTKQVQTSWTFDFEQPLLTLEDANNIESKLNSFLSDATTGQAPPTGVGQNPLVIKAFNAPVGGGGGSASP